MKKLLGVFVLIVLLMPIAVNGETKWVEPGDLIESFPPGIGTGLIFYVGSIHYLISYQTSIYYSAYVDSKAILVVKVLGTITFGSYSIKSIPITSWPVELELLPGGITIIGDTVNVENLSIGLRILEIGKRGAIKIRAEELR